MQIEVNQEIQLSPPNRSDIPAMVELLNNPEIVQWTLRIRSPYTPGDAANWINLVEEHFNKTGRDVAFAIRRQGELVGGFGFEGIQFRDGIVASDCFKAEIGYWVGQKYWNQGIATKVIARMVEYGFQGFQLKKMVATVFCGNAASENVLKKTGFELEGEHRWHYIKDKTLIDAKTYGIYYDRWSATQKQ